MIDTSALTTRLDGLFTQDLNAGLMQNCIEAAVVQYSRYNPRWVRYTVDVVEDTDVYDVPASFLMLDWFDWWPTGEPTSATLATGEVWEKAYNIMLAEAKQLRASPYVRVMGSQYVLDPTPTTDETVDVAYYALHTPDGSGDYTTIPDADESIMLKLAVAELLELRSPQITVTPDVTEGLLMLQWRQVPLNTAQTVSLLRKSLKDKYGGH